MILWLDGALVPAEAARIDPADRGLLLGDGLFETMRARDGAVLRLEAHLARLRAGTEVLRLDLPYSAEMMTEAIGLTLQANGLENAVLRLTVTRGAGGRGLPPLSGLRPTVLIAASPLPTPPEAARAVIARGVRRNAHSPQARIKSLNRLDDVLARMEAVERGADDALLLNTDGRLAEATASNLFVVLDEALVTPPVSDGALPGTVREALLRAHGAEERSLSPEDFSRAGEAFLTNALGVRPLVAVEDQPIGNGAPGPITRRLSEVLFTRSAWRNANVPGQ